MSGGERTLPTAKDDSKAGKEETKSDKTGGEVLTGRLMVEVHKELANQAKKAGQDGGTDESKEKAGDAARQADKLKVGTEIAKPAESNPFRFGHGDNAIVKALSARTGIMGLRGELVLNKEGAVDMLRKTGGLGEQLATRVSAMEAQGWSVGRLTLNDPYLAKAFPNPIKRAAVFPALAGYNSGYHEGLPIKRVTYNTWSHLLNQTVTSFGRGSPATRVVGNLAHELGHWDGVPLPEVSELPKLTSMERRVVANRLLQTETNAIIPQLYASQKMGAYHADIEIYREALRTGNLGSLVRNRWVQYGQGYEVFNDITPAEADAMVKNHLESNYKGVVQKGGKIGEYDLAAVRGKYVGETSLDGTILKRMQDPVRGVEVAESSLARWAAEGSRGKNLLKGGQAIAGLGIALMGTDIAAGFYEGKSEGYGKTARAAFNLGMYEVGSFLGSTGGALMTRAAMKTKYGHLILPATTILVGMGVAGFADAEKGHDVEAFFKQYGKEDTYDTLYETRFGHKPEKRK